MGAGDVGYIIAGIKDSKDVKVGDTITLADNPCDKPVKGFEDVKPMVFAGILPPASLIFPTSSAISDRISADNCLPSNKTMR